MGTFQFLYLFLSFSVLIRSLVIVVGVSYRHWDDALFLPFLSELMNLEHMLNFCSGTEPHTSGVQPSSAPPVRQSSPRGRIFPIPLHNEPDDDDQDFNTTITNANEFLSPGGGLKRARRTTTGRLRTRHSSLSSSGASDVSDACSERVRDMVDSLEKSAGASASAVMMMTGSAPSSPTKGRVVGISLGWSWMGRVRLLRLLRLRLLRWLLRRRHLGVLV